MKKLILSLPVLFVMFEAASQLKPRVSCGTFTVDILDGVVNGLRPDIHPDKIKEKLPCFSTAEKEAATAKCGGGVFYKDRDIYFYTSRDYVEIGEKFKGKLSLPLMNAKRTSLYKWLGKPQLKDPDWEAYQTQYGCLVLYFRAGVVKKIQFSTKGTGSLQLCQ